MVLMNELAITEIQQLAQGTGIEDNPMLFTAYRMLQDGQHPISVAEKIKNLGGDIPVEALVKLRYLIPGAARRASQIFPDEIITDPVATYHKAFALQRERLQDLLDRQAIGEAGLDKHIDQAIITIQGAAVVLAEMLQKLGYNPYSTQSARGEDKGPSLTFIMNATPEQLKQIISGSIDAEVVELD